MQRLKGPGVSVKNRSFETVLEKRLLKMVFFWQMDVFGILNPVLNSQLLLDKNLVFPVYAV
jgi:hypothetical protein